MSPVKFEYLPGRIAARFSHDTHDYIHLDIHLVRDLTVITPCDHGGKVNGKSEHQYGISGQFTVYMSSPFCAFGDLIAFLEAIAVDVQHCSFRWEAEGPEGRMSWSRSTGGMGNLGIQWYSRGEDVDHCILLDRHQAVQALYGAFRAFVESSEYDPFCYEALSLCEAIEVTLQDGTPQDVVNMLAGLEALEVEDRIHRLLANVHARSDAWKMPEWPGTEGEKPLGQLSLVPAEWNEWTAAKRAMHLAALLDRRVGPWFGANLRKLRSPLVESMLAKGSSAGPSERSYEPDTRADILH